MALEISPHVEWLSLKALPSRDWLREQHQDLGCLAATCAIQLGQFEEAVELLDFGRSVFWRGAMSLPEDLKMLREVEPRLAEEFERLSGQLAGNSSFWCSNGQCSPTIPSGMETFGHLLVGAWEKLTEKIRRLPDFENFLKPLPFHRLRQIAAVGQVVIINVSRYGVDALIFGATGPIKHVPLPNTNLQSLTELSLNITLKQSPVAERQDYTTRYLQPALQTIWEQVLVPVFENISLEGNTTWPQSRIWWYPTGPLTVVPIHAAGPGEGAIDVSRIVISSYVSTLESIFRAKERDLRGLVGTPKFLTISPTNTPAQCTLPRSTAEAENVVQVISSAGWPIEDIVSLNASDATVDRVSVASDSCSFTHFACYGIQHSTFGTPSVFAMQDGNLELGQIVSERSTTAQFAFLSACHAATGLQDLPGEGMHLAGELQFAGFSNVIGTMRNISDEDAAKLISYTYEYLLRNGVEKLDHSEAATALNRAVLRFREDPEVTLDRWASFIHFGI